MHGPTWKRRKLGSRLTKISSQFFWSMWWTKCLQVFGTISVNPWTCSAQQNSVSRLVLQTNQPPPTQPWRLPLQPAADHDLKWWSGTRDSFKSGSKWIEFCSQPVRSKEFDTVVKLNLSNNTSWKFPRDESRINRVWSFERIPFLWLIQVEGWISSKKIIHIRND